MSLHQKLYRHGVVVIRDTCFSKDVKKYRDRFLQEATQFQEFKPGAKQYVLGGFAALGNASSFHNPTVRLYREWAMAELIEKVFRDLIRTYYPGYKLEQVIDRMMIRLKGQRTSKDDWHRDEAPLALPTDVTFGGWLNLDECDQVMSVIKKSHRKKRGQGGFHKLSKEEFNRYKNLPEEQKKVKIPPGAIIIFYEHIVHEIVACTAKQTMARLFLGWRLTQHGTESIIPDVDNILTEQACPRIKSKQVTPMYAKLHWNFHRPLLAEWSRQNIRDEFIETLTVANGPHAGERFRVCRKLMPSLLEMRDEHDFKMYPSYSPRERAIYHPNHTWRLRAPCKERSMQEYSILPHESESEEKYDFPRVERQRAAARHPIVQEDSSDEEEQRVYRRRQQTRRPARKHVVVESPSSDEDEQIVVRRKRVPQAVEVIDLVSSSSESEDDRYNDPAAHHFGNQYDDDELSHTEIDSDESHTEVDETEIEWDETHTEVDETEIDD